MVVEGGVRGLASGFRLVYWGVVVIDISQERMWVIDDDDDDDDRVRVWGVGGIGWGGGS